MKCYNALIIEDEAPGQFVEESLKNRGLKCNLEFSCERAMQKVRNNTYNLVIVDIGIQNRQGIKNFPEQIRKLQSNAVIIGTSALSQKWFCDELKFCDGFLQRDKFYPQSSFDLKGYLEKFGLIN